MKSWLLTTSAAIMMIATTASAQQAPKLVAYKVEKEIGCAELAQKLWGDRNKYDFIHANNTWLGPQPHMLKVGTVLMVPPPTVGVAETPDAHLDIVRNQVAVEAPDARPGRPNDPLFRGNRVGTRESSLAEVGFRDDTKLWLGERSLVIILGDTRSKVGQGDEATLVTGGLRAFVSTTTTRPLSIGSGAASAVVGEGEVQVTIDATKTTRLAQYTGSGELSNVGKTTKLNAGFGSKAIDKTPPSPPKPLPPAPTWSRALSPLYASAQPVDVSAEYTEPQGAGDPIAQFHVQLAKDAAFTDLITDTRVPSTIVRLDAKGLTVGSYFARVSAIDNDEFEGPYGVPTSAEVVAIEADEQPHSARLPIPLNRFTCRIDGGPWTLVTAPLRVSRTRAHKVECSTQPSGADPNTFDLAADKLGAKVNDAKLMPHGDGAATLTFKLTDASNVPVADAALVMKPPAGVEMSAPVALGDGRFTSEVHWKKGVMDLAAMIAVNDVETTPTGALPVHDAPVTVDIERQVHGELAVSFDASAVNDSVASGGVGGSLGFSVGVPIGQSTLAVGGRGSYSRLIAYGDTRDAVVGAIPFTLSVGARRVRPTFELAPIIASVGSTGRYDALLFGGEARIGASIRAGSGAFYANVGGQLTNSVTTKRGPTSLSGLVGAIGYCTYF